MPSFRYLGALAAITTSLFAPLSAQNTATSNAKAGSPKIQHVVVRGTGNSMEVEIQTSGTPVAPDTQAITGPDRIVVDFPGAVPSAELRALKVNSGALKAVRAGLFFSNPPITRVVLDLAAPQSYQISTIQNAIVVRLGSAKSAPAGPSESNRSQAPIKSAARLQNASLNASPNVSLAASTNAAAPRIETRIETAVSTPTPSPLPQVSEAPKPPVTVTFANGMLRIHAEKATLAQVLFEVQRQTQAEIAIPAGAEQEQVAADLGPAPARDVLASLLNGSPYNFIFVGNELSLERVILSRRDGSLY
jgi:hypothetical protein